MARRVRFGLLVTAMALAWACDDDDDTGADNSDASAADASPDSDAAEPFVPTGVIDGVAWGPSFFGVASDVDDSGAAADVGLGVLWDPDHIDMTFADATCFVVHTRRADAAKI